MSFANAAADPNMPIEELRAVIARLEGYAPETAKRPAFMTGAHDIDSTLPWHGLPRGALHDIVGHGDAGGAASGFCLAMLARLCDGTAGSVLWIDRLPGLLPPLYGHGLAAMGLDPDRLIVARARTRADLLWAAEEGLRTPALAAVVAVTDKIDTTAARRLQLAAETEGVTALLLRPTTRKTAAPLVAATHWHVAGAPAAASGAPRWRLDLVRCRGFLPRTWLVEWSNETRSLAVAAETADRPIVSQAARMAG